MSGTDCNLPSADSAHSSSTTSRYLKRWLPQRQDRQVLHLASSMIECDGGKCARENRCCFLWMDQDGSKILVRFNSFNRLEMVDSALNI